MKKRFLSIFLALVMCLTLLPTMALARSYRTYYVDDDSGSDSERGELKLEEYGDHDHPFKTIAKALEEAGVGDIIVLLSDITENVNITKKDERANRTITLDLNGHVLKGDGTASVITVGTGVTLTLTDSNPNEEHAGYVDANGLWHLGTGDGAEKSITGGVITGGNVSSGGGGVVVGGGTLNMYGGTIAGNEANMMETGACSGGVYVNNGLFTMRGGAITNNTASAKSACGGGVLVYTNGEFDMSGGTITDNTGTGSGYTAGGVCFCTGTVTLGGKAQITGNTKGTDGTANNLYLPNSKYVTISGDYVPASGMSVGVTTQTAPTKGNPQTIVECGASSGDEEFFTSDVGYSVVLSEGKLQLVNSYLLWVGGTQVTTENEKDVLKNETVSYDPTTKTLTLNGATITKYCEIAPPGSTDPNDAKFRPAIYSEIDLTICVNNTNALGEGKYVDDDTDPYKGYKNTHGIYAVGHDLTFTGIGTLEITDLMAGIKAEDITFDAGFKGNLTVHDYGATKLSQPQPCAISATGNVTINGGTFDLTSELSRGIYAEDGNVTIENAKVTVNAGKDGICAYHKKDRTEHGHITIKNATVNVTAEDDYAIYGNESVKIIDSTVKAAESGFGICSSAVDISGDKSDVTAFGEIGIGSGDECTLSITGGVTRVKGSALAVKAFGESEEVLTIGSEDKPATIKNAVRATSLEGDVTWEDITEGKGALAVVYLEEGNCYAVYLNAANENADEGYLTISFSKPSSTGGSSGSTITVPVSGDKDSVKVTATVSGGNATVKNVTSEQLETVGTGENVTIDLSSLSKSVSGVTIPKTTLENVAASDADGLEVKLPNGTTAVFDSATVAAVAEQAAGSNIQLVVDKDTKAEKTLTNAQKETVKALNNPVVLDAYFVSNGTRISDFKGGEAELTAEYPTTSPVRVWYVAADGSKTLVPSTFDGKAAKFVVTHFSHYAIEVLDGSSYAACPQDNTCVYAKFTDADTKAWYHDGVHYCVENGMMNGVSATQFAPNGTLTRGMVVTVLARLSGETVTSTGDKWYADGQAWAVANGVSDGTNMTANITREQLATMLYRYAVLKGIDTNKFTENTNTLSYNDVFTVSDWATSGMHFCIAAGVVNGDDKGNLNPHSTATRAEAATMFQRFSEKVLAK